MNFFQILLILAIIAMTTGVIVFIYLTQKHTKQHPIVGKTVVNLLYKYTEGEQYGKLVKKEFIGKDKQLRRIIYMTNVVDEFGNKELKYFRIIVHKDRIIDDEKKLTIYPKSKEDINPSEPVAKEIKKQIKDINDKETIVSGFTNSQEKLNTAFMNGVGGQVYSQLLNQQNEIIKNLEKKPEEKEVKK